MISNLVNINVANLFLLTTLSHGDFVESRSGKWCSRAQKCHIK